MTFTGGGNVGFFPPLKKRECSGAFIEVEGYILVCWQRISQKVPFSIFSQTLCSCGCLINTFLIIHQFNTSVSDPFPLNLQNIITPKPQELCLFPTMCKFWEKVHLPSNVMCNISRVTFCVPKFLLLLYWN